MNKCKGCIWVTWLSKKKVYCLFQSVRILLDLVYIYAGAVTIEGEHNLGFNTRIMAKTSEQGAMF